MTLIVGATGVRVRAGSRQYLAACYKVQTTARNPERLQICKRAATASEVRCGQNRLRRLLSGLRSPQTSGSLTHREQHGMASRRRSLCANRAF